MDSGVFEIDLSLRLPKQDEALTESDTFESDYMDSRHWDALKHHMNAAPRKGGSRPNDSTGVTRIRPRNRT